MSATAVKSDTLLEVRDLRVVYREAGRFVPIVDGVSFSLRRGEALGLAGESGCGKTTTALALHRDCCRAASAGRAARSCSTPSAA